jgi:hypothetical protein
MHPLIEEAAKKAAVAWLTVPGAGHAYPIWHLWADGALHVVAGPGEQSAPALGEAATAAAEVLVTIRGDHGGRVVSFPTRVTVLTPDSEEWATIAPQLAGKRLNSPGGAEQTAKRWATDCQVFRLTPTGDPGEAGGTLPAGDLVASPRPTDAARHPRKPFKLHRVRKTP